ncbi:MAG: Spy/CpxP family protein refolding chaperone [Pyrinomonadaceae bacterium]|nr:Spy/CpxP family protein refolding chaperone [Acidobacteriota bacterium]MBK7934681.1 Spy/CpxP family protein refolding chaperone [Acidobacteriota bacterium]MBP7376801.1 Spy/CpxP family protein refolding chaperone [Pyrinomonadaceae bacterium]
MKKIVLAIIAVAVVATGAIFVIAQKRANTGGGHGFGHGRGDRMGMALRGLDLSDEQKAKVKEIMEANKAEFEPTMQAMKDNRAKIQTLGTDGTFDQARVEGLAKEQGDLVAKTIVQKASVKAQVFAVLTDEQKAKAAEMRTKFEGRGKDHKGFGGKHGGSEF